MPSDVLSFPMPVWTSPAPLPDDGRGKLTCPICGADLNVHQPEALLPGRLLASCACEECAIWLALVFTPDHSRVYMVRVPTTAELWDALATRGGSDGPISLDGRGGP